jgi:hypothetical protein
MRLLLVVYHPIRPKRGTHWLASRSWLEMILLDPLPSVISGARRRFSPTGC